MSYIGNSPNYQNFARDKFNGGAASYTLTYTPGSQDALLVVVNGVVQDPTTDYTVSGTTLTPVTAWPAGTSNVVVLYLGRAADVGTPADTTVSTAKIVDNAVTTAKIADANVTGAKLSVSPITNSIGADVALNNTANFFDGPSVAQGASGTWFVSGTVTLWDTAGPAAFRAKLWDGTTVIASASTQNRLASCPVSITLSGYITNPTGNLRISVKDSTSVSGAILKDDSGVAKDSTITAIRIG